MNLPQSTHARSQAENITERLIFTSRWILAPVYAGLSVGLLILLIKFFQQAAGLLSHASTIGTEDTIVGILGLVDLSLMGSLVVMVMFAGYENFVSKLDVDDHIDKPDWMGHINFSDLKLRLIASIIAISAIQMLESFMHVEHLSDRELGWKAGILLLFVITGVLLAAMDRLSEK